jgi:hypothetical protein
MTKIVKVKLDHESNLMFLAPLIKKISLLRKALPGTITELAKLRNPITDCNSTSFTFLLIVNSCELVWALFNLSIGNLVSIFTVSISIPYTMALVVGKFINQ